MLDKIIDQIIGKPAPVGANKPNKPKTESSIGDRLWSLLASIKSWFESMPGIFFRCTKKPSDTVDPNKIIVVNKKPVGNVDKIEAVVKGPQEEFFAIFNELENLEIKGPDDVTRGLDLIEKTRKFKINNPEIIRDLERIHQNLHMAGQVYRRR